MMRDALLLLFWVCLLGTFIQGPMLCYEFWLLATQISFSELTVGVFFEHYLTPFSWFPDLLRAVFGAGFGGWILGLPITLVTIVKLISGTFIGYWALATVRAMDNATQTIDAHT